MGLLDNIRNTISNLTNSNSLRNSMRKAVSSPADPYGITLDNLAYKDKMKMIANIEESAAKSGLNTDLYTEEDYNNIYKNRQFVSKFGKDTFQNMLDRPEIRDNMLLDSKVNEAFEKKYKGSSAFDGLNSSLTTLGKKQLLDSGYEDDRVLTKEEDRAYRDAVATENFMANLNIPYKALHNLLPEDWLNSGPIKWGRDIAIDMLYGVDFGVRKSMYNWKNSNKLAQVLEDQNENLSEEYADKINTVSDLIRYNLEAGNTSLKSMEDTLNNFLEGSQTEEEMSDGSGRKIKNESPGFGVYRAYKDSDELSDLSFADKIDLYAKFITLANEKGPAVAYTAIQSDLQKHIYNNQDGIDKTKIMIGELLPKTVGATLQQAIGLGAQALSLLHTGAEAIDGIVGGDQYSKDVQNQIEDYLKDDLVQGVNDMAEYGVWSKEEGDLIREKYDGIAPNSRMRNPEQPFELFSADTALDAAEMIKFAPSFAATRGAFTGLNWAGKTSWGLWGSRISNAALRNGLKGFGKYGLAIGEAVTSSAGISLAYAQGNYNEVKEAGEKKVNEHVEAQLNQEAESYINSKEVSNKLQNTARELAKKSGRPYDEVLGQLKEEEKEYYKQQNIDKVKEEHAGDYEMMNRAAADAFAVDVMLETARMATLDKFLMRWTMSKASRETLGISSRFKHVVGKEALEAEKQTWKHWAAPIGRNLLGGFESNFLDDVNSGIAKELGLSEQDDYLHKKYNPEAYNAATMGFLSRLISSTITSLPESLSDAQTWYDGFIGGLGSVFQGSLNPVGIGKYILNKASKGKWFAKDFGEDRSWQEKLNTWFFNPVLKEAAETKREYRAYKQVIDNINESVSEARKRGVFDDIASIISVVADTEGGKNVDMKNLKDAKFDELFHLTTLLHSLNSQSSVAKDHPYINKILKTLDGVRNAEKAEDIGDIIKEFRGTEETKGKDGTKYTDEEIFSRIKGNVQKLDDFYEKYKANLDTLEKDPRYKRLQVLQDIYNENKKVKKDYINELLYLSLKGENAQERINTMLEELGGGIIESSSKSNLEIRAEYANRDSLLKQIDSKRTLLKVVQEHIKTLKEDSQKDSKGKNKAVEFVKKLRLGRYAKLKADLSIDSFRSSREFLEEYEKKLKNELSDLERAATVREDEADASLDFNKRGNSPIMTVDGLRVADLRTQSKFLKALEARERNKKRKKASKDKNKKEKEGKEEKVDSAEALIDEGLDIYTEKQYREIKKFRDELLSRNPEAIDKINDIIDLYDSIPRINGARTNLLEHPEEALAFIHSTELLRNAKFKAISNDYILQQQFDILDSIAENAERAARRNASRGKPADPNAFTNAVLRNMPSLSSEVLDAWEDHWRTSRKARGLETELPENFDSLKLAASLNEEYDKAVRYLNPPKNAMEHVLEPIKEDPVKQAMLGYAFMYVKDRGLNPMKIDEVIESMAKEDVDGESDFVKYVNKKSEGLPNNSDMYLSMDETMLSEAVDTYKNAIEKLKYYDREKEKSERKTLDKKNKKESKKDKKTDEQKENKKVKPEHSKDKIDTDVVDASSTEGMVKLVEIKNRVEELAKNYPFLKTFNERNGTELAGVLGNILLAIEDSANKKLITNNKTSEQHLYNKEAITKALKIVEEVTNKKFDSEEDLRSALSAAAINLLQQDNSSEAKQAASIIESSIKILSPTTAEHSSKKATVAGVEVKVYNDDEKLFTVCSPDGVFMQTLNMQYIREAYGTNSPNYRYFLQHNINEFLRNFQIQADTKIYFILDPELVTAVKEDMDNNGKTFLKGTHLPIVVAVKSNTGTLTIKEDRFQPISVLPSTGNINAMGSNYAREIRNRVKDTSQNNVVAVGSFYSNSNYIKIEKPKQSEEFNTIRELLEEEAKKYRIPEANVIKWIEAAVEYIISRLSLENAENPNSENVDSVVYRPNAFGTDNAVRMFFSSSSMASTTSRSKAFQTEEGESMTLEDAIDAIEGGNKELLKNFSFFNSIIQKDIVYNINKFIKDLKDPKKNNEKVTAEFYQNLSYSLYIKDTANTYNGSPLSLEINEEGTEVSVVLHLMDDKQIKLTTFNVENYNANNIAYDIIRNLMLDETGHIRKAKSGTDFVRWQISWSEIKVASRGIAGMSAETAAKLTDEGRRDYIKKAKRNIRALINDGILGTKYSSLFSEVKAFLLNKSDVKEYNPTVEIEGSAAENAGNDGVAAPPVKDTNPTVQPTQAPATSNGEIANAKGKKRIAKLKELSRQYEKADDESGYTNKNTGEKVMRVTNLAHADENSSQYNEDRNPENSSASDITIRDKNISKLNKDKAKKEGAYVATSQGKTIIYVHNESDGSVFALSFFRELTLKEKNAVKNFIDNLENKQDLTSLETRETIFNSILKNPDYGIDFETPSTNSGTGMDAFYRDAFAGKLNKMTAEELEKKYPNASGKDLAQLVKEVQKFKNNWKDYDFVTDEITVAGTVRFFDTEGNSYEKRVAGTVDMIAVNKNTGDLVIIDFKTMLSTSNEKIADNADNYWNLQTYLYQTLVEQSLEESGVFEDKGRCVFLTFVKYDPFKNTYTVKEGTNQLLENGKEFRGLSPKLFEGSGNRGVVELGEGRIPKVNIELLDERAKEYFKQEEEVTDAPAAIAVEESKGPATLDNGTRYDREQLRKNLSLEEDSAAIANAIQNNKAEQALTDIGRSDLIYDTVKEKIEKSKNAEALKTFNKISKEMWYSFTTEMKDNFLKCRGIK